jgi:exodeoxyribonuclease VII large subunit
MLPPSEGVLSVSQLARQARILIEEHLGSVTVEGELSNFRRPGSGHWYFTLKDDKAQIRCAMFAGRNRLVRLAVTDGLLVQVSGRVSLYEPRGDFQLIVDRMAAAGEGALRAAFEALKDRLAAEGLFDADLKKPLPEHPRHLTIISSASGAALKDVLHVIERRFPGLEILLIPSAVQGDRAQDQLIAALATAAELDTDVVLLTRGGGSLEDLWAFNLEPVARAVAACPHPVVSAVGHQTDFTITDFVADVRAPTPSAAAELITPTREALTAELGTGMGRLERALVNELRYRRQLLAGLEAKLVHPATELAQRTVHTDEMDARLLRSWAGQAERRRASVAAVTRSLGLLRPDRLIEQQQRSVSAHRTRLDTSLRAQLDARQLDLAGKARALSAVSPLNTLQRGYAVLRRPDRSSTVGSVSQTEPGDRLEALLADGTLAVQVTAVDTRPPLEPPEIEEIP